MRISDLIIIAASLVVLGLSAALMVLIFNKDE